MNQKNASQLFSEDINQLIEKDLSFTVDKLDLEKSLEN
jgi:hypothetical protein